jgi:energy-coupling factor transporter ATP-binding protein EcfA2
LPLYVTEIAVRQLFGRYDYDLVAEGDADKRLLILYGDNGSGKTTILNLLFHLLNHVDDVGHKSAVAEIPFAKLRIRFVNGLLVVAERPADTLVGSFRAYIEKDGVIISDVFMQADKDQTIKAVKFGYQEQLANFLAQLAVLKLAIFYITDDRQLLSNTVEKKPEVRDQYALVHTLDVQGRAMLAERAARKHTDVALHQAIEHATEWLKTQAITDSTRGDEDANTIYAEIVDRLAKSPALAQPLRTTEPSLLSLVTTLREQAVRSEQFAQFGLLSPRNIEEVIKSLIKVEHGQSTVVKIIEPYVDGIKARLDALQGIQHYIAEFVSTVNSFLVDKTLRYDLRTGMRITAVDGTVLKPSMLSSGEKQLLLLFCNSLVPRNEPTLFLLDEPEISLNIKWQRRLIKSLLKVAGERNIQFVFSTHSFELLAPHSKNVLRLESTEHETKGGTPEAHPRGSDRNS